MGIFYSFKLGFYFSEMFRQRHVLDFYIYNEEIYNGLLFLYDPFWIHIFCWKVFYLLILLEQKVSITWEHTDAELFVRKSQNMSKIAMPSKIIEAWTKLCKQCILCHRSWEGYEMWGVIL